jgi:hypothetical protein
VRFQRGEGEFFTADRGYRRPPATSLLGSAALLRLVEAVASSTEELGNRRNYGAYEIPPRMTMPTFAFPQTCAQAPWQIG